MNRSGSASDRLVVLFILGIVLFSPPFLLIFDNPATILGIPALFLYLFVAWAMLIALIALVIEKMEDGEHELSPKLTTEKSDNVAPASDGKD